MATVLDSVDHGAWGAAFTTALSGATSVEGRRLDAIKKVNAALGELFAVASEAEDAGVRQSDIDGIISSAQRALDIAINQLRSATTISQIDTLRSKAMGVVDSAIDSLHAKIDARSRRSGGGGGGGTPSPDDVPVPEESGISTGTMVGAGLALGAVGLWLMYQRRGG